MAGFASRGILTTAGALAGLGQGIQQAAAEGQRYLSLNAIQASRQQFEMEKLKLENELAAKRQERQMGFEREMQGERLAAERALAERQGQIQKEITQTKEEGATARTKMSLEAENKLRTYLHDTVGADTAAQIEAETKNLRARLTSAESIADKDRAAREYLEQLRESGLDRRQQQAHLDKLGELGIINRAEMERLERQLEAEGGRQERQIEAEAKNLRARLASAESIAEKDRALHEHLEQLRESGLDRRQQQAHLNKLEELGIINHAELERLERQLEAERGRQERQIEAERGRQERQIEAEKERLEAEHRFQREKITLVPRADGTLVGVRLDGNVIRLIDPETKKPLEGAKDLPPRTKLMVETLTEIIQANVQRLKTPGLLPDEVQAIEAHNEALRDEIAVLLGFKERPSPKPKLDLSGLLAPGTSAAATRRGSASAPAPRPRAPAAPAESQAPRGMLGGPVYAPPFSEGTGPGPLRLPQLP